MTLMQRRRALMGAAKMPEILFQLPSQIEHIDSKQLFFTGYAPFTEDRDFTIYVDINQTLRDGVPFFCAISDIETSATNITIQSRIRSNGGISVGQWPGAPGVGNVGCVTTKNTITALSNYSWAATGRVKLCIVHQKRTNNIRVLFKFGNTTVTETISLDEFPETDNDMASYFRGTLYAMTVYSTAKSDSECNDLME